MNAKPALVRPRFASDLDPQVALWTARLCTGFSAAMNILNDGMHSEELRQILGISPTEGALSKPELKPLLKLRIDQLQQRFLPRTTVLTRNVDMLSALLGLDKVQAEVLAFTTLSRHQLNLREILESIRTTSTDALTKVLSIALKVDEADIRKAIQPEGPLRTTRLIALERSECSGGFLLTMSSGLRTALFTDATNIQMLMSSFLETAAEPNLNAEAFVHLNKETELLAAYLSKGKAGGASGINVLIYGSPGTGKTEYARWLASHLGKPLYQVKAVDDEGDAISGLDRLAFFQLSQHFLQQTDALMLFDEIEDVFPSNDTLFSSQKPTAGKMFINRLLENNPVPAIWISNEIAHMDKAYLRRFDFSFEMGIPPIAARRGILHNYLDEHAISGETINALAQHEQLSPAQVEKAAKILTLSGRSTDSHEATLSLVIENSQALLGQHKNDVALELSECTYQLDYLNPDCDLNQLVAQLKRAPTSVGALCFYGAPGTGKTALAHYIAREIDRPLLVRRASDILRPHVGETEMSIARMFQRARQEGAVLLLDEADSFLSDRQSARTSWEVSAVNEMLTQMERFDGLFICSTNLMQRLDAASLRRFALKIKFDYLRAEQRWQLFMAQVKDCCSANEREYRTVLNQLNNLTPGDFATVRRQAALLNVVLTADELLERLAQECESKNGRMNQPIGFIHTH